MQSHPTSTRTHQTNMKKTDFPALLKSLSPHALWILDIDSTLVLTHKRNEAILHQFSRDFSSTYPEFCKKLSHIECRALEYGYSSALERAGIASDKEPCDQLATFWRKHFFSGDFLHHDIIHDKALEFVMTLHRQNKHIVYLTGRPRPSMYDGTLKELRDLGFPVTPEQLFLKPHPQDKDELFKSQQMKEFKNNFSSIVFIDNEPKVLNQIDIDHPDISLLFIDTCHSPHVFPPAQCLRFKKYDELLAHL